MCAGQSSIMDQAEIDNIYGKYQSFMNIEGKSNSFNVMRGFVKETKST